VDYGTVSSRQPGRSSIYAVCIRMLSPVRDRYGLEYDLIITRTHCVAIPFRQRRTVLWSLIDRGGIEVDGRMYAIRPGLLPCSKCHAASHQIQHRYRLVHDYCDWSSNKLCVADTTCSSRSSHAWTEMHRRSRHVHRVSFMRWVDVRFEVVHAHMSSGQFQSSCCCEGQEGVSHAVKPLASSTKSRYRSLV